jgi:hypothetical protein
MGTAELFAVADTETTGIVATDALAGVAAFGPTFVRSVRANARGPIPCLPAGAGHRFWRRRGAPCRVGRVPNDRRATDPQQPLQYRTATGSRRERPGQQIEFPTIHEHISPTNKSPIVRQNHETFA